jgi:EmrB/QacA subfamily drug resistance transporter
MSADSSQDAPAPAAAGPVLSTPVAVPAAALARPRLEPIPASVWRVSIVVVVGAFMTQFDTALVTIGLASVARSLHSSLQVTQWIVSGYLLALVIGMPLAGWASRRAGAGRTWLLALAVFTIASAACAWSGNIAELIIARAAQGLAAGLLLPSGQAVIAQVAGRERIGRVMSTVGTALVLGPALGPVIGSQLISHASWPWLFLVNLPVGAAGLWLGWRYIPRGERGVAARFDLAGFILIGAGLPVLTYAISAAGDTSGRGWRLTLILLVLGVLLIVGFTTRGMRVAAPLLDIRLFGSRVFSAAAAASFLAGVIQFGGLVIWALYFQVVCGDGIVAAGLSMLGFAVGAAILPLSGRLADRYGGALVCLAGAALTACTVVPMALLPRAVPLAALECLLLFLGVANALSVVPASTAAYVMTAPAKMPEAITQINVVLRLGGAVGASLLVAVLGARPGISGFHAAFWALLIISVTFIGVAIWLTITSGAGRAVPANGEGKQ